MREGKKERKESEGKKDKGKRKRKERRKGREGKRKGKEWGKEEKCGREILIGARTSAGRSIIRDDAKDARGDVCHVNLIVSLHNISLLSALPSGVNC